MRPRFNRTLSPSQRQRAQGKPGARCTRSLVCSVLVAHECSHHRSPGHPAFPAQWFYGLCRALPGDEFVLVTVIGGLKVCRTRSGSKNLRQLDTSNGCQDHTVLPSAHTPFVCAPLIAHRPCRPALRSPLRAGAVASTASRPASVTIASRPSGDETVGDVKVIWVRREGKYFCKWG
jgi:hypothetical protein